MAIKASVERRGTVSALKGWIKQGELRRRDTVV